MYSEKIAQKSIETIEKKSGIKLVRTPIGKVSEWCAHLDSLMSFDGKMARGLNREEQEFIRNERLVSMCDFRYWAPRYCSIVKVGGGEGKLKLWESQQLAIDKIATLEERVHEYLANNYPVSGIRIAYHKSRQLGATMVARGLSVHRMVFSNHQRGMAASVDDDKVMEMYDKDKFILDNLPWWMKPQVGFDVKGEHLYFDKLNTRILYQQSQQNSGLGQGRTFEVSHLTECAFWKHPKMISMDLMPAIPQSPNTLCILESTANGRGNWWHEWTEEVRKGEHIEWTYCFIPWYTVKSLFRRHPPDDWRPSKITEMHADMVKKTSHQWVGTTVDLDREQLYWWETERASHLKSGDLAIFLTNRCATPEESFQHSSSTPFSAELLERLRMGINAPTVYEILPA